MRNLPAARPVLVAIVVVFALVISACGGSDSTDAAADDVTDSEEAPDSSEPAESDSGTATNPSPAPTYTPVLSRDCDHVRAEADAEEAVEVELPPAEKPPVDEALLGEVDELVVTDLIEGTGDEAVEGAMVQMQYVGVLASDGTEFDSSWDRGAEPIEFALGEGNVIPGWDEGLLGMRVGGRRVLQIPSDMAYGPAGRGPVIGPDADLIFIVDMVGITVAEAAPPIPDDALGSFDELGIIDLVEGTGCAAELGDILTVEYVGVNGGDGVEFDSTWGRGATFTVTAGRGAVIDGWNEGLLGMKVGGERIIQIPPALAYDGPDHLVFRVHLVSLIEAPPAHTLTFEGDAPAEVSFETITEGEGEAAEDGAVVDAQIAVMQYKSGKLVQSTWEQGLTAALTIGPSNPLPALNEPLIGIKVGELRQIVVPPEVAYPNGIPASATFEENDGLVFLVEAVRITNPG